METEFILLGVMILMSAFFSGLEIALFSLGRAHLHSLVESGVKGADAVQKLKANPERLLVTILIGNNIANIGAASLATALAIELVGNVGVGIATGIMTVLILLFGEITPKTFAVRWSEKISLMAARPLQFFGYLVFPATWVFEHFSRLMTRMFSRQTPTELEHETVVTTLSRLGLEEGKIEEHEYQLVVNAFRLDQTTAERIMTPRNKMAYISSGATLAEAQEALRDQPYSRYPVLEGEKEAVTGVLHLRDMYEHLLRGDSETTVDAIAAPPIFVAGTMPVNDLLLLFQRRRTHMAIVMDEYGDTDGVVTMEDALEELVGEIEDEADMVSHDIIRKSQDTFVIRASLTIDDINRALEAELPAEVHNTLNGLLVDRFQDIPKPHSSILIDGYHFTIRQADARKIDLVEMRLPEPEVEEE